MTIVVFILYLLMMLGIGAYFSRKANSLNAYYLGNRGMNKWVVAMSAQASDMSGWMPCNRYVLQLENRRSQAPQVQPFLRRLDYSPGLFLEPFPRQ